MPPTLEATLAEWDGEQVLLRRDHETGAWAIIAIHSTALGPACGGTRMRGYPSLQRAVADALALAAGMTLKFAAVDFAAGGGKAVIWAPPGLTPEARDGLLRRHGEHIRRLGGLFRTGPDVGTSPRDMDLIAERGAPYVFCTSSSAGAEGSAPLTAVGVFAAVELLCARARADGVRGAHVAVQGVGSVGRDLVRRLLEAGARVTIADVDADAAARFSGRAGVSIVSVDALLTTECDVLSPCALGGVLSARTIAGLRCRAIAGAANNMLAAPQDAARLRERGILYAPDFLVNIGGALGNTGIEALGWSKEQAVRRVRAAVRDNLREVIARAERRGRTTEEEARALARARLLKEGT